jgi:hypothetical protein
MVGYKHWQPNQFVHNKPLRLSTIQSGFAQNGAIKKHGPF